MKERTMFFWLHLGISALAILSGLVTGDSQAGAVTSSPITTAWGYRFARCDSWHDGYINEAVAEYDGKNLYYGSCGNATVVNAGAWGIPGAPQGGPCGSSNLYPSYSLGIENYNMRSPLVTYCGIPGADGFTINRYRSVQCPTGYTPSGLTCVLQASAINPFKNAGPQCPANGTNPINAATGNKYQREVDAPVPPGGLGFERHYNSSVNLGGISGSTGLPPNWRHTYARSIVLITNSSISTAIAVRPEGNAYFFTLSSGVWTPDSDVTARLDRLVDGAGVSTGWRYTAPDYTVEGYDVQGKLVSITDKGGRVQILTYTGTQLTTVTDSFGRVLTFTYRLLTAA